MYLYTLHTHTHTHHIIRVCLCADVYVHVGLFVKHDNNNFFSLSSVYRRDGGVGGTRKVAAAVVAQLAGSIHYVRAATARGVRTHHRAADSARGLNICPSTHTLTHTRIHATLSHALHGPLNARVTLYVVCAMCMHTCKCVYKRPWSFCRTYVYIYIYKVYIVCMCISYIIYTHTRLIDRNNNDSRRIYTYIFGVLVTGSYTCMIMYYTYKTKSMKSQ